MLMIIAIIFFVIIPSCKDRIMPIKKLLITPAIFVFLFYQTINGHFLINNELILLGALSGITIGLLVRSNTAIKSDKSQLLIWIPGSYISLMVFCFIFLIHFIIGYLQSIDPTYLTQASSGQSLLLFLLSCSSTVIIGANAMLYWKYLNSSE